MSARRRDLFAWAVLAGVVSTLTSVGVGAQEGPSSVCVACHLELDRAELAEPARTYEAEDVHAAAGFGCTDCHGAGGVRAGGHDPAEGFLAAPIRSRVPALCGGCHSDAAFMRGYDPGLRVDQVTEYRSSVHGQLLLEAGDPDVPTCVGCHPAHRIRPPSDPESTVHPLQVAELCGSCHGSAEVMEPRGHSIDQFFEYLESVHARLLYEEGDLAAPTCNDCHGNHGAAPPGLSSVRHVCGQCHATMADYFTASGHVEFFDADVRPGCVTCHGSHAIQGAGEETLTSRASDVCNDCHGAEDPYGDEFRAMRAYIDSLQVGRARARALLEEAENRGMETSDALFELEEVNNALTMARAAVHSFHIEPVAEALAPGYETVATAWTRGMDALREHRFRRSGLSVSTVLILALILGLVLRIRALNERRPSSRDEP